MKPLILIFAIVLGLPSAALAQAPATTPNQDQRLRVVTTTSDLRALAKAVGSDRLARGRGEGQPVAGVDAGMATAAAISDRTSPTVPPLAR
jgi:hypothetical protein